MKIDLNNSDLNNQFFHKFNFKSGESHITFKQLPNTDIDLYFRYTGDSSLFSLAMAVDAIKRINKNKINLYIPYFPGARQDRVCNYGEPLSVKVYTDFINNLNFDSVHIFDPHSDVVCALINNVIIHYNHEFIKDIMTVNSDREILVSPDAGANKKIYNLSQYLGGMPVIRADKIRNVKTGQILETIVYSDDLTGKSVYIVDDICSGGRTFTELAKVLKQKNAKEIFLIVSHFEGVANLTALKESGINKVYTTDSFPYINTNDYNKDQYVNISNVWKYME